MSGIRVEHALETFKEGQSVILTLKDKYVLDEEEDDALVNVNIIDEEKAKKNVENKKKKPAYKPYDEFDEFGNVSSWFVYLKRKKGFYFLKILSFKKRRFSKSITRSLMVKRRNRLNWALVECTTLQWRNLSNNKMRNLNQKRLD